MKRQCPPVDDLPQYGTEPETLLRQYIVRRSSEMGIVHAKPLADPEAHRIERNCDPENNFAQTCRATLCFSFSKPHDDLEKAEYQITGPWVHWGKGQKPHKQATKAAAAFILAQFQVCPREFGGNAYSGPRLARANAPTARTDASLWAAQSPGWNPIRVLLLPDNAARNDIMRAYIGLSRENPDPCYMRAFRDLTGEDPPDYQPDLPVSRPSSKDIQCIVIRENVCLWCTICDKKVKNLSNQSNDPLISHLEGAAHMRNAVDHMPADNHKFDKGYLPHYVKYRGCRDTICTWFYCGVCDQELCSDSMCMHLLGARHKEKLGKYLVK